MAVLNFPPKLCGTKDRQHYVFRHYLLPWASDGQIWVARNGNIFPANVLNVAVERHFYKLQDLTDEDITLIRRAGINGAPKYVQDRCETLIDTFTGPFKIRKLIDPNDPDAKAMLSWLDERVINHEEELQGDVESTLLPALAEMRAGRTDFYADKDQGSGISPRHQLSIHADQEAAGGASGFDEDSDCGGRHKEIRQSPNPNPHAAIRRLAVPGPRTVHNRIARQPD
jgi:hypothetical protein